VFAPGGGSPVVHVLRVRAAGHRARGTSGEASALHRHSLRRGTCLGREVLMLKPRKLDLVSSYLCQPVLGVHGISLQLEEEPRRGHMTGKAGLDPNICSLDLWGDREGCTRMAIRSQDVEATQWRTPDLQHHHRIHWSLDIKGMEDIKINLIEYPGPNLWYLSIFPPSGSSVIVPLFDAELFALHAARPARPREAVASHA
jgi:hypothetical protein